VKFEAWFAILFTRKAMFKQKVTLSHGGMVHSFFQKAGLEKYGNILVF
jgi:hypothetical protein